MEVHNSQGAVDRQALQRGVRSMVVVPVQDPLRNDNDQGSEGRRWSCGRPVCGSSTEADGSAQVGARSAGWDLTAVPQLWVSVRGSDRLLRRCRAATAWTAVSIKSRQKTS